MNKWGEISKINLGEIGEVKMCKRVLKEQTSEYGEIPFYKISTFGGIPDTYISKLLFEKYKSQYPYPKKGDILISAAGTIGKTVIFNGEPSYFQDSNIVWIDNNETIITNQFLYYFFQTKPWLSTNGSTITRIYNDNLRSISIVFPKSIELQQRITSALSSLDDKINLNIRINAELETMIKRLYGYWFIQFDFPCANGEPYKASAMPMIFKNGFNIPEHWTIDKLGSLIDTNKGGDWGKDEASDNYTYKVSCIRGADINYINGENGESKLPNRYILAKNKDKVLEAGDIVIEISGGSPTQSTGRAALIIDRTSERFDNPLICSNFCRTIILKDKRFSYYFYYLWRTFYDNGVFFNYEGKTSGLKNMLFDMFVEHTGWYIPDIATVERFNEIASAIHNQKETILRQNKELAELRDWLLPLLMNGQVTIKDQTEDKCAETQQAPRTIPVDAHILGGHIVKKLHNTKGMGRTKLQKALHLVEYHCELSLNSQSMQFAAGPHDQELMNHIDQKFRNYGHVKREKKVVNGRPQYKYTPATKIVEVEQAYEQFNPEKREKIDNLLDKLAKMDLGGAEILSTLYAVWNNRLIRQEPVTDDLLAADFYAWSDHKSDFPESRVRNCLDYMRKEDIIPVGWGKYIDDK